MKKAYNTPVLTVVKMKTFRVICTSNRGVMNRGAANMRAGARSLKAWDDDEQYEEN